MTARERFYPTIRRNDSGKRVAFSETNSKASIVRRYDPSANIGARQSAFRLLALNSARGFGK